MNAYWEKLILELQGEEVLNSKKILDSFKKIDRADFLPTNMKKFAYEDEALSIGYGQTISQPYTVAFMLDLLAAEKGNSIMEVGFGSGWQTALLADLAGKDGKIYAFEIVKELCDFGKYNLQKYPVLSDRVELLCQSAKNPKLNQLIPEKVDRIIAAAEVTEVPGEWRDILKVGGVMVYPKDHGIFKETKISETSYVLEEFPGFVFVPFVI